MKLHSKLAKTIISTTTSMTVAITGSLIAGRPSVAQQIRTVKCPTSGSLTENEYKTRFDGSLPTTIGCFAPATAYHIDIYEVGLCTQSPILNGAADRTNCITIFSKPTGTGYLNIANTTLDLSDGYIPSDDAIGRSHVYIVLNPTIRVSGTYATTTNTYYIGENNYLGFADGAAGVESKTTAPSSTLSYTTSSGNTKTTCSNTVTLTTYAVSYIFLTAANSAVQLAGGACPGATKLMLSMPTSATVTARSKLNIRFNVSEYALVANQHDVNIPNKAIPAFSLGIPLVDVIGQ